jgi:ABC-type multidrug transport system fused ATPase/permease subunit
MGFIMDGLDAEAYDRNYKDSMLVRRIVRYFWPHTKTILLLTVLVVASALLDAAFPLIISHSLDNLVTAHAQTTALIIGSFILLSGGLWWVCNLFRQWYSARAVGDVVLNVREDAFNAVMERDMSFFDEFSSGKIVSRVTSDTDSFATVVTLTLNLLSQLLLFVILAVILFFINYQLALLALIIVPLIIGVALLFRHIARISTQRSQRSVARVNANVQEIVSGITIAKNFRQEQNMYDEFKQVNEQSYQVNLRSGYLYNGIFPVLFMIANLGLTINRGLLWRSA